MVQEKKRPEPVQICSVNSWSLMSWGGVLGLQLRWPGDHQRAARPACPGHLSDQSAL